MAGGRLTQRAQDRANNDIDMKPVMNLFVAMVPFLLLCVSFYQLAGVTATVPTVTKDGEVDVAQTSRSVTLTVSVTNEQGYIVLAQSFGVDQQDLDQLRMDIPKKEGVFDHETLNRYLLSIKTRYPGSDTILIVPNADVSLQNVVTAMDAARDWIPPEERDKPAPRKTKLFPRVVLSRML